MDSSSYFLMKWYQKLGYNLVQFLKNFFPTIWRGIKAIPKCIGKFFCAIGRFFRNIGVIFAKGDALTRLSFIVLGLSNVFRGQIIKGFLFMAAEAGYIYYMVQAGWNAICSLQNLGTQKQGWVFDEAKGIDVRVDGDNSMLILLFGVMAVMITIAFIMLWRSGLTSALEVQQLKKSGKRVPHFKDDVKDFFDKKLYKTMLFFPALGVILFTILPLAYMICIAFTNYDSDHQPPGNLFTWVGLDNFKTMLDGNSLVGKTFWPILGWTVTWAILATFLNYVLGMLLAMLINKKGIKFKSFWRTMFVFSIAIPQFVSLLLMRNLLNDDGALNMMLMEMGLITEKIKWLSDPMLAKVVIVIVNLWIGIPYSMLITTGILINIPEDLYESARIDGASPVVTFFKITLPYVMFVTAPYLITQFIGNLNNFNVIYLLTSGNPANLEYYQAGSTDLLVTWLYKLTANSKDYSYASTIGILVFVISAVVSLFTYRRTSAYKNEEGFM